MKSFMMVLGIVYGLGCYQTANAKVVVEEGNGRCAACVYTAYFYNAADITPMPDLSKPIVTPSGATVERIDDPKRGLLTKDPSGLLWTTTLAADYPYDNIRNQTQYPAEAINTCNKIGARLPTLAEFKNLAKLFYVNDKYDKEAALKILEPRGTGYSYIATPIQYWNGNAYGKLFELFGSGKLWSFYRDREASEDDDMTNWKEKSNVKCVISQDMLVPADFKQKY